MIVRVVIIFNSIHFYYLFLSILVINKFSLGNNQTQLPYFNEGISSNLTKVIDENHEIIKLDDDNNNLCPLLKPNLDSLTQEQFILQLTDNCRYDKVTKPPTDGPLLVYIQIDLSHIEAVDQLQFKAHMLVQYLYRDNRLRFEHLSPNRGVIIGEELIRNKIWAPHLIIRNERDSNIMGRTDGRDVFVSITPQGDVVYSNRMTTTFYCWMNLEKFPFDSQNCNLKWSSWTYNSSSMVLHWVEHSPVRVSNNLHLTEFVLSGTSTEENEEPAFFDKGSFVGNYSEIIFNFQLSREVGYYIMDYYLPSILLVSISWVTFWLQADASAPRVTLGTSTMLAFITLNGGLTKNLPKVSYIKASEIWFLGCAFFIFCSMAEFAFVNVIWRRRKKVELKKQSSKHILKGALTPRLARKQLRKAESMNTLYKTRSCSSLDVISKDKKDTNQSHYLTVHGFSSNLNVPVITTQSQDNLIDRPSSNDDTIVQIQSIPDNISTWQTMTPQEVANWIDKKSRITFPISFLVFNMFYWSFVYFL